MTRGTLSLLVGAHQFIVHPIAVIIAYRMLYKCWPDLAELLCIIVHDWGYWGCPNMDGDEGSEHPELGARIARRLLKRGDKERGEYYYRWCYYHSRHLAKCDGVGPSLLCWADKLGTAITPWWLYLPGAWLSGELEEYRWQAHQFHAYTGKGVPLSATNRQWFSWMTSYMRKVAYERNSKHQLER